MPAWVRSTLITFAVTFAASLTVADFAWTQDALVAAAIAAARTAVSGLVPGGPFGVAADGGVEEDRPFPIDNAGDL